MNKVTSEALDAFIADIRAMYKPEISEQKLMETVRVLLKGSIKNPRNKDTKQIYELLLKEFESRN